MGSVERKQERFTLAKGRFLMILLLSYCVLTYKFKAIVISLLPAGTAIKQKLIIALLVWNDT
jgi:hypothetical protein